MASRAQGSAGLPGHEVRKARPGETLALSRALARAFFEDPLGIYVVPDPARRLAIIERGFDLFLRPRTVAAMTLRRRSPPRFAREFSPGSG